MSSKTARVRAFTLNRLTDDCGPLHGVRQAHLLDRGFNLLLLDFTPELRERFLKFREVYENTKAKLAADDASAAVIE